MSTATRVRSVNRLFRYTTRVNPCEYNVIPYRVLSRMLSDGNLKVEEHTFEIVFNSFIRGFSWTAEKCTFSYEVFQDFSYL